MNKTLVAKFRNTFKTQVSLILVLALVAAQSACDRTPAIELANLGMVTGQALTEYYESLVNDTNDTWDMELFWVALIKKQNSASGRGIDPNFDDEDIKLLKGRIDQLNSRVKMAKQMRTMYTELKDYASYDAGASVEIAAKNLSSALTGLIPVPGVNAAGIIGAIAGDLERFSQIKDLKEKIKISKKLMDSLNELFEKEESAYALIAQENNVTATAIAQSLIENEMVLPWGLLDKIPTTFGVKWVSKTITDPPKDDDLKKGFIAIIKRRNDHLNDAAKSAAENLGEAIKDLAAAHAKYLEKKPIDLSNVASLLGRAKFYLGEIQKLKQASE